MTRGVVTFVFDDGYRAVYDRVLPLLRQYGIRGVFAVPTDTAALERAEGAPVASLEEWRRACSIDDHELAAHGVTHRALTTVTEIALNEELEQSRTATAATTLVYPGGAHDDRVVAAARQYFRAARTVRRGFERMKGSGTVSAKHPCGGRHRETVPDPFRLRSFVATRDNFQVWKWNLRALWAWCANRWLIETHHNVSFGQGLWATGHGKRHTIPLDALERHLRFVRWLPLRIATIRDVVHADRPA